MKKKSSFLTVAILMATFISSCTTSRSSFNPQNAQMNKLSRQDYNILETTEGIAESNQVWLLFIPIGGKPDERLFEIAYNDGVDKINRDADGIIEPRYSYKRTVVPLILFTYVGKSVSVKGKAYRLKTDEDNLQQKTETTAPKPNFEMVEHQTTKSTVPHEPKIESKFMGFSVGDGVYWVNFSDEIVYGEIVELDEKTATIKLKNGKFRQMGLDKIKKRTQN